MSDAEFSNDNKSANKGTGPTRSCDSSGVGPGRQIGQFRIERELGRGAAGVVYLAHDTKLDRSVAIKSLPAELMQNPRARTRFSREARVLASLNHPNIATIHEELQETEGIGYLVLEYIPGQTLAERIAGTKLKPQEALSIAQQIAEAVATAHEHDVIHRDLKPGNIKITPEGNVKVLDFGLAKALGGEALDQQSTVTEPGRVIGTPAYMCPEQARGQETDKRCDIWSFGCVLYEMLTGKVPFEAETASDTLAQILQTEPDWQALPKCTPASICVMLHRCLEKEPNRRLRDVGDAAIEIRETLTSLATTPTLSTSSKVAARYKSLWQWIVGIAFVILIIIAVALLIPSPKPTTPTPLFRYPISLPRNQMLNQERSEIALSPDGGRLVYVGGVGETTRLFLRDFGKNEQAKELPETKGARLPFFSHDGQQVGFVAGGKLRTLFLDVGRPQSRCDAPNFAGGSWGADNTIFFSPTWSKGLWEISADERVAKVRTTPDPNKGEYGHWWPEVLPGGETVLFTIWKTTLNDAQVAVLSIKTGKWQTLINGATHARYASTGHLLYAQSGTLWAAPFDLKRLKVGEPRVAVAEGLKQRPSSGYAPFCFSKDCGVLYYVRGGEWLARRQFVWVNRKTDEVEPPLPLATGAYSHPRLSPDGQRLAFTKFDRGAFNIWVYEFASKMETQLTFESNNFGPLWTTDGKWLTFTTFRAGPFSVYWMPADGSSAEKPLVTGIFDRETSSWSPDDKKFLFVETDPNTGEDIWLLSVEDGNTTRPLLCESWNEREAVFSPDGDWIAYVSDAEVRPEVYVTPYPKLAPKKISTDGGFKPLWSQDSNDLFYRCGDKMIAVTFETEPEFRVNARDALFEGQYITGLYRNYDVSHDGQRFLMITLSEEEVTELVVVPDFFEELKRRVPAGKTR